MLRLLAKEFVSSPLYRQCAISWVKLRLSSSDDRVVVDCRMGVMKAKTIVYILIGVHTGSSVVTGLIVGSSTRTGVISSRRD